jgi:predicted RNase H-like HicB family nuclease
MLPADIEKAMLTAIYMIGEDGDCYGEIPGFSGVWARAESMTACREVLQNALEDWLLQRKGPPHLAA